MTIQYDKYVVEQQCYLVCGEGDFGTCLLTPLIFNLLCDGINLTHRMTHQFSCPFKGRKSPIKVDNF
jgi:hypothetical protein